MQPFPPVVLTDVKSYESGDDDDDNEAYTCLTEQQQNDLEHLCNAIKKLGKPIPCQPVAPEEIWGQLRHLKSLLADIDQCVPDLSKGNSSKLAQIVGVCKTIREERYNVPKSHAQLGAEVTDIHRKIKIILDTDWMKAVTIDVSDVSDVMESAQRNQSKDLKRVISSLQNFDIWEDYGLIPIDPQLKPKYHIKLELMKLEKLIEFVLFSNS